PVRQGFARLPDPATARRALGLAPQLPTVVAMAGTQGSLGRLSDVVRALLAVERPMQAVVVAGRDDRLRDRLTRLAAGSPLRVVGYVDDVPALLAAVDLLVTKAGGMTLAEATAAGVPLLLYGSLPGQERGNERFASRAGIALVARSRRGPASRWWPARAASSVGCWTACWAIRTRSIACRPPSGGCVAPTRPSA